MSKKRSPLLKFMLVGLLNTGVDMAVFSILIAFGTSIVPAQWISYGSGTLNSYIFNRSWTFGHRGKHSLKEVMKFISINLLSLVLVTLMLHGMYNTLGLPLPASKLISTASGVLINYAGSGYWVFLLPEKRRV